MNYPMELTQTYEIYEQIGAGGGGTVYRAIHKRLQKTVVIKKLKGTATSIQDFRTEVDILKNLRHSYLPQVIDFIDSSEGIFTVMDFIPGKSLQNMLDENHQFTEKEVLKYARQLCEALSYLHSQNPPIIHGDIKPDNIMITPEGNVCLIDFNISGILEGKGATTFGYTKGYSAPEQAEAFQRLKQQLQVTEVEKTALLQDDDRTVLLQDEDKTELLSEDTEKTMMLEEEATMMLEDDTERTLLLNESEQKAVGNAMEEKKVSSVVKQSVSGISIDKRSDIYSVGATLYALLTGKIRNPKDKKLVLNNVSSGFSVVLAKALAYAPEKRYQDAGQMYQALVNVHKKDKKYRSLLVRQELTVIILLIMLSASVFLTVFGKQTMEKELETRYETLISVMEDGVERELTSEEFEEYYEEAISIRPDDVAPYYARAYYVFNLEGVDSAKKYITQVLDMTLEGSEDIFCNLYHLYAECHFRQEDYEQAQWYYKKALTYRDDNPSIYRDYAISLACLNRITEAEELLTTAAKKGMTQIEIYMVQGEIARMSGDTYKALSCFSEVIAGTEDEYMKQRAYIMASKVFSGIGTVDALKENITWLKEASEELTMSNRLLIYERMVETYIKLGELEKDDAYYVEAIDVMKNIINMGWDTYLTYSNTIVLYQRIGDIVAAREWALKMCDRYPDHYVSYMRLAFAEVEEQNARTEGERNYQNFVFFYEEAKKRYQKQTSGNVTNAEMQLLENVYQQLIDGNWIEK